METESAKKNGLYNHWNFDIARFASKDVTRYTMQSILVKPDLTAVTDGHTLITVTTPDQSLDNFPVVPGHTLQEPTADILLPSDAALKIGKGIPRKNAMPILKTAARFQTEDGTVGFVSTNLEQSNPTVTREVAGKFFNYQAVIPNGEGVAIKIAFDGRKLADLCKFMGDFTEEKHNSKIVLTLYSDSRPVKIEATNVETGQTAVGVLMPVRI